MVEASEPSRMMGEVALVCGCPPTCESRADRDEKETREIDLMWVIYFKPDGYRIKVLRTPQILLVLQTQTKLKSYVFLCI